MEIKFKNNYLISTSKEFVSSFEMDVEQYLLDHGIELNDEDDLLDNIMEYMDWDACPDVVAKEDEDNVLDNTGDIEFLNIEEVIEHYKYLIKEKSCCDSEYGTYCSKCGKKLK